MPIHRTWPYGTKRKAQMMELPDTGFAPIAGPLIRFVVDELNEGHMLVGEACCDVTAKPGDVGTLTFCQGGSTGGYWRFVRDPRVRSITCPKCQRISYNSNDIAQKYCGHCHEFHSGTPCSHD